MKKKEKTRKISLVTALLWRMSAALLALWLTVMCFVTVMKAIDIQQSMESDALAIVQCFHEFWKPRDVETVLDVQNSIKSGLYHENTAFLLLENGSSVMDSYRYAYIHPYSAYDWYTGNTGRNVTDLPTVRIDVDNTLGEGHPLLEQLHKTGYLKADAIRVTGYFDSYRGTFIPVRIAVFNDDRPGSDRFQSRELGQRDAEGALDWTVLYDEEPEYPVHLMDLYAMNTLSYYQRGNLESTDNPIALGTLYHPEHPFPKRDLIDTRILRTATWRSDGFSYEVRVAVWGNPLKDAMMDLIPVYILTLLIPFGLIHWYHRVVENKLGEPVKQIIRNAQQNMSSISLLYGTNWTEIQQLQQEYIAAQQEVQGLRQENQQLKTALHYAQDAEVNRRQLVSNITHELKTPLAVIHSYAEGLQEGIAPEKQSRYLEVITEEADRMDAMVLEMLDLSRLEAGKVRLAQDSVELLSLTEGIMQKLEPLMEVKALSAVFAAKEVCHLTADENRLAQVVTNLITNAIKYSPQGGTITLTVYQWAGFTHFRIENQSEPLSEDALSKVWESFYRTEESRTTKGTGLGLSICKAIIELHRGTCHVQNTSNGVEFGFTLPV